MAPRRRGPKSKRPSMAAAKKMITKAHKAKAKRNMDTYFLKCKNIVTLTPQQGVAVANYVSQNFSMDPTGNAAITYLENAEFLLWKLQYDKFRVNSVTIRVTPKANVQDLVVGQDNTLNLTGDGVWHTVVDRDGKAPPSKALLARYPSYRKHSLLKPFTRTYAIKYPTGVWIDSENPAAFHLAKELGLQGSIGLYAENILEDKFEIFNQPVCQVEVSYNIVFQGKTSNSLSGVYDASGNLTGVTTNAIVLTDLLPETPFTNVSGTLAKDTRTSLDVSGNALEVPVNDKGQEII